MFYFTLNAQSKGNFDLHFPLLFPLLSLWQTPVIKRLNTRLNIPPKTVVAEC